MFRRRLGYNALEHAVLAVYCQIVIIAAQLLSLSPTLVWTSPDFIAHYKALSGRWMYVVKLLVVGAGFHQFFVLEMRRDWPRSGRSAMPRPWPCRGRPRKSSTCMVVR